MPLGKCSGSRPVNRDSYELVTGESAQQYATVQKKYREMNYFPSLPNPEKTMTSECRKTIK